MKMKVSWFGIALIVIGTLLVLERLGVLRFSWWEIFWGVVALASIIKIVQGFSISYSMQGRFGRGKVFWWTVIGSYAAYRFFHSLGWYDPPDGVLFALMLITIGVGVTLVFFAWPRDWHVLIPAILVLSLGVCVYLSEMGYIYRWSVVGAIHTYWPVALILFGGALLLNSRRLKNEG